MKTVNLELIAYRDECKDICFIKSNIHDVMLDLFAKKDPNVEFKIINKSVEFKISDVDLDRYARVAKLMYLDLLDEESATVSFLNFHFAHRKHNIKEYLDFKAKEFTNYVFEKFIICDQDLTRWLNNLDKKFVTYETCGPDKPENFNYRFKFYIPEKEVLHFAFDLEPNKTRVYDHRTDIALDYFLPRYYQSLLDNEGLFAKRPDIFLHLRKSWIRYCTQAILD